MLTSYASSSTLAQQIVHGAEADVLLSADTKWADYLADNGLVAQRRDLLGNRLVIVVPKDGKIDVRKPEDLLAAGIEHLALGEPQSVPAGRYAKQALSKLGLWPRLEAKVVPAGDVRQALAYVETGAAEAGIVYATDAAVSKRVRVAVEISRRVDCAHSLPGGAVETWPAERGGPSLVRLSEFSRGGQNLPQLRLHDSARGQGRRRIAQVIRC